MNQRQINRLEMFQDTDNYLNENQEVWSAIPIVGKYKNDLTQIIEALKEAAQDQQSAQLKVGKTRKQQKLEISRKMDILDDILEAYAADTNNETLRLKAQNSSTDYFNLKNEEFETKIKNVITLIDQEMNNMSDYGMSPALLEDAQLSFNNYSEQAGKPRAFQVASRIATANIEDLIKEGSQALERLDKVLKRFKRSNKNFYYGYEAARMIVDD